MRYVFWPVAISGPESIAAMEAAYCAQEQGRFWEYHDILYKNQAGENRGAFSRENLEKFATELGLNLKDFTSCLDSGRYSETAQESKKETVRLGIRGTPTLYINERKVEGLLPFSRLQPIIEEELAK